MIFFLWLILFGFLILAIFNPLYYWLVGFLYLLGVIVRVAVKYRNYKSWLIINKRDERLELEKVANDMANRGLTFSGFRTQAENKVKEDFEFERKKVYGNLWIELVNSLFLK